MLLSFPLHVATLFLFTLFLSSPLHAAILLSFSHYCFHVHVTLFLSSLCYYSLYYFPIRVDTISLDLWMSKGAHNVLVLVINLLELDWKPKQVIIDLFEDAETTGQALARNLIDFLNA